VSIPGGKRRDAADSKEWWPAGVWLWLRSSPAGLIREGACHSFPRAGRSD